MVADSFEITLIFSGLNQKLQRIFASQDLIAPLKPKRKRCGALEEVYMCARRYMFLVWHDLVYEQQHWKSNIHTGYSARSFKLSPNLPRSR